ncbi:MAG: MerC domain-containing protein [Rudaea sp.]
MNSPTAPELPGSAAAAHDALAHIADRVGATASFLCAVHCAALPFVLAVLPALGLGFLADHKFERIFIACASCLALAALIRGYRRHHVATPLRIALPGLILLWAGAWIFDAESALALHATLVTIGGCTLAYAHIRNLRLTHSYGACCDDKAAAAA